MSARARLVNKFRSITKDRVAKLNNAVVQLERTRDEAAAEEVARELHTLKGEAKLLGFVAISTVAHKLEELMMHARESGFAKGPAISLVLSGLDTVDHLRMLEPDAPDIREQAARYCAAADSILSGRRGESLVPPAPGPEPRITEVGPTAPGLPSAWPGAHPSARPFSSHAGASVSPPSSRSSAAPGAHASMRVSFGRLDDLADVADELLMSHGVLHRQLGGLQRVEAETMHISDDLRTVMARLSASGPVPVADIRAVLLSMRNRQEIMTRQLRDALRDLSDNASTNRMRLQALEAQVRDLRLMPLGSIFEAYPRAIRDMARAQGKRVELDIFGADVEVDKHVLDRIDEPLLHLIRNCVDHGVETPAERQAANKSPTATVTLLATQDGARVVIEVVDDGRGVDTQAVAVRARALGLCSEEEAAALSERRAIELLFTAGFSTRTEATDLSGRGIGLDAVKTRVEALGGTVTIETRHGEGTRAELAVPVSVVRAPMLLFAVGGGRYGIPSVQVASIATLRDDEVVPAAGGEGFRLGKQLVRVFDLAATLNLRSRRMRLEDRPVVAVRHGDRTLGLFVDEILGEEQVIQREVGKFLHDMSLINGSAIASDGELIVLLNLAEVCRATLGTSPAPSVVPSEAPPRQPSILVVDDSDLTRDMMLTIVSQAGYSAREAVDGREALRAIQQEPPDLVITDLEMPVMDGFELLGALREEASAQRELPVIVCSTRGTEEDKRRASVLGADAYVVKSQFSEQRLLDIVEQYLGRGT